MHVHHHVVIQDLKFLHAIFSKMDNGSILCNLFVFTAIFSFILYRVPWLLQREPGRMKLLEH